MQVLGTKSGLVMFCFTIVAQFFVGQGYVNLNYRVELQMLSTAGTRVSCDVSSTDRSSERPWLPLELCLHILEMVLYLFPNISRE